VDELNALIEQFTRSMTTRQVLARLDAGGVPAAEVRDPATAVRDPQVTARGETVPLAHPKYGMVDDVYGMGMPIRFSGATVGFDQPAPALGEHNDAVYGDVLGYSSQKIQELKAQNVI
jgi:crotonobetainyl-CoA:carnitine CoA-transferase CaiB-like acyl-CoA transferase